MRHASAAICKITLLLSTLLIFYTLAARQRPLRGNTVGEELYPKGPELSTQRSKPHIERELSDACTGRTGSLERTGPASLISTVSNHVCYENVRYAFRDPFGDLRFDPGPSSYLTWHADYSLPRGTTSEDRLRSERSAQSPRFHPARRKLLFISFDGFSCTYMSQIFS